MTQVPVLEADGHRVILVPIHQAGAVIRAADTLAEVVTRAEEEHQATGKIQGNQTRQLIAQTKLMKSFLGCGAAIAGVFIVAILAIGGIALSMYNGVITSNNQVDYAWGQVQNVYQRRADLIPNLVNTVKGAAAFEKDTFTQVSQARASVGQIKLDPSHAPDQATLDQFAKAQQSLGSAISRLMMVQERYPDLKANRNFTELQAQLEGTENRISTERKRFNDAVLGLNNKVTTMPSSFFANMAGVQKRPMFEADAKAKDAPKVEF